MINYIVFKKKEVRVNFFFCLNKGMEDVSSDRDEQGCLDAIIRLKNGVRVRGEHKQKIQIHLSLDGVKVMDELTKV